MATIADESIPPERNDPSGTSATISILHHAIKRFQHLLLPPRFGSSVFDLVERNVPPFAESRSRSCLKVRTCAGGSVLIPLKERVRIGRPEESQELIEALPA